MKKIIIFILLLFIIITGIYIYKQNKTLSSENSVDSEISNTSSSEIQNENLINETNSKVNTTENTSANNISNVLKNENKDENTSKEATTVIVNKLSPSGFMGSSFYRVDLYSNGDVYVITFDGNGYEDSNIISKNLVAKNASSIEMDESDEGQGGIIIMYGEKIDESFGWISFSE